MIVALFYHLVIGLPLCLALVSIGLLFCDTLIGLPSG
jgi:hypothetical protein